MNRASGFTRDRPERTGYAGGGGRENRRGGHQAGSPGGGAFVTSRTEGRRAGAPWSRGSTLRQQARGEGDFTPRVASRTTSSSWENAASATGAGAAKANRTATRASFIVGRTMRRPGRD